jgi:hypothetical protein
MTVELALHNFHEKLKQPMMVTIMKIRKPALIQCILQDSPDAINELQTLGVFKEK